MTQHQIQNCKWPQLWKGNKNSKGLFWVSFPISEI